MVVSWTTHTRSAARGSASAPSTAVTAAASRPRPAPTWTARQHDGLRPPRHADRAEPGHLLHVRGAARRRPAGRRHLPTAPRGRRPVHLHQLRRPVGAAGHLAAGRQGRLHGRAQRQQHPGQRRHRGRHRAGRPAVPPAQRRPLLRQPRTRTGCAPGTRSSPTTPARRATGRGCRRPATTRTRRATARSASAPTRPTSSCPATARDAEFAGLWYAFTVGSVRVISLQQRRRGACRTAATRTCSGYSGGAQQAWLEGQLRRPARRQDIDWIVVCMHQVIDQLVRRERRRPRHPRAVGPAVRQVRGGPGGLRPRARLRALAAGARRRVRHRDADPEPGLHQHRRHRHLEGHHAHGARRRRASAAPRTRRSSRSTRAR